MDGRTRYGFIAEDTAAIDEHLATHNASGTVSGIDDRSIVAILVSAVKELAHTIAGFAERFTTKELIAINGSFNALTASTTVFGRTVSIELCLKDDRGTSCYTRSQLDSLLNGSVLGSLTEDEETASAPEVGATEAPAATPASPQGDTDTASTGISATSSPPVPEPDPTEEPEPVEPASSVEPANDNSPAPELPATGTQKAAQPRALPQRAPSSIREPHITRFPCANRPKLVSSVS